VPYIYEDYASIEDASNAMLKLYEMNPFEKEMLSKKVYDYATKEFSLEKTVDLWHETMKEGIEKFKKERKNWEKIEF